MKLSTIQIGSRPIGKSRYVSSEAKNYDDN